MGISNRIEGSIENWRIAWGKALHDFIADALSWGLELILDIIGRGMGKRLDTIFDAFASEYNIPPEIMQTVKDAWKGEGEWQAVLGGAAGGTAVGSLIGSTIGPWLKLLEYVGLGSAKPFRFDPSMAVTAWKRDVKLEEDIFQDLRDQGWRDDRIEALKTVFEARFDPASSIILWRRFKEKWGKYIDDLKQQGWDDDRIEALKDATLYYPSPAELVHWTAREVFEPDKIAKYGLMADADKLRRDDFYKAGMDDTQIDNHWVAHWEHASWTQIIEMLHRGIIDEKDVKDWFPLVEVAPFWADNLIKIAYTWPTRVDVRRFWDMRTITEQRLSKLYEGLGYHGDELEDYIKWTKVYTDFPMMMARFKNTWIEEQDVRDWLGSLEIPEDRIEQFIQEKTKPEAPARVVAERDLTKAEIVKGVKKGHISVEEGIEMLMDLGYSRYEAEFKVAIDVGALEGSPDTYMQFKRITELYKQSQGREAKIPSETLIQSEIDCRASQKALDDARKEEATPEKIAELEGAVEAAKIAYHQLLQEYTEK